MHGWYSKKQDYFYGSHIYIDAVGKEVNVTLVLDTNIQPHVYDDYIYVGVVHNWIRRHTRGKLYPM